LKGKKKITIGKRNFVVADKTSARIADETTNVLEKAQNRVEATFEGKNSFSILNSFSSQIFVNVASSCGINLGINKEKELDVISTVLAKERAQALLAETSARKERQLQDEKIRKD
jgi:septin family protein